MSAVRATPDAYIGLEDPSVEEWEAWHRAMLEERAGLSDYADAATDWSDTTFRQLFLFMYDASFYDGRRYRTTELVEKWRMMFGRVDSVLLWHAYPRLGFDSRSQFDFYRDMPGGVVRLRAEVSDVLHSHGLRVFVDFNPWAEGGYDDLGEVVAGLDADGVMLDTMTDAPEVLAREVARRRRGVVFAPELRPRVSDLSHLRQAWAQWSDVGDGPSILRHRWLVPRHRQFSIRRWDASRKHDIVYSFFNGSGLLLWDNVFGTWNPYSRDDRRLIAETGAIFDQYAELFAHGEWLPLIPTGVPGLDANRWAREGRAIVTLRNRTGRRLVYRVPSDGAYVAFWGERHEVQGGDTVAVEPGGLQALVLDAPDAATRALAHFEELSKRADVAVPGYDERIPRPVLRTPRPARGPARAGMIEMPGGDFEMKIRHERRECGCYPFGATELATWGFYYKDTIEHATRVSLPRYAIRRAAVTNAEFLTFVRGTRYRPDDDERFLKHLARPLPDVVPVEQAVLPVTFVSLADARAFAAWHRERLPTEAEWQWAAEGAGLGNAFPWGDEARSFPSGLRPAIEPGTATPQGVMGLSGNTWELTESEHTDGHTRFVMLRGGVFLPPGESEWLVARGARPNDFHAKYVLMSDGLDRSDTISFRTVVDLE
jgi:formylglycine-generating enzyme required for sulfatase activity